MYDLLLDSGAHTLYNQKVRNCNDRTFRFYDSKEFWQFVDDYAEFILENKDDIICFVNVDAIFNPEKTLKIQDYMEKEYDLKPMPVVHYGEDLRYVDIYIDKGYDYIGIGGLGQEVTKNQYFNWADDVYNKICDKDGFPKVKTHGFAMTSIELMMRYPWYSVDSTSWLMSAMYGSIYIPIYDKSKNEFLWTETPSRIAMSTKNLLKNKFDQHYNNMNDFKKEILNLYLKELGGFKIGETEFRDGEEIIIEEGLENSCNLRSIVNIYYMNRVQREITRQGTKNLFLRRKRKVLF